MADRVVLLRRLLCDVGGDKSMSLDFKFPLPLSREEVRVLKKELSEVTARDKDQRRSLQRRASSESMQRPSSARSVKRQQQQEEEEWLRERDRKVEEFRKNRSARNIQKNWKVHHKKVSHMGLAER